MDAGPGECDVHMPMAVENADLDETKIIELQSDWEKRMKHLSPRRRHLRVEALLLHWDKKGKSFLDTEAEVKRLGEIFRTTYSFNVTRKVLNPPKKTNASLLMNRYLSEFIDDHDLPDTLLIIYYAGHGHIDPNGSIIMRGNNEPSELEAKTSSLDAIAWSKTEPLIDLARHANFLVIFDCCFAGRIGLQPFRRGRSKRNVEFLGACGPNQLAEIPGEKSFTTALIWALKELAKEEDGFTTAQLYNKIRTHETFPKDEQSPVLITRTDCNGRLMIAPLTTPQVPADMRPMTPGPEIGEDDPESGYYCLNLDFILAKLPEGPELENLCEEVKDLVHTNSELLKKIMWSTLYRKPSARAQVQANVAELARYWRDITFKKTEYRSKIHKTRLSEPDQGIRRSKRLAEALEGTSKRPRI